MTDTRNAPPTVFPLSSLADVPPPPPLPEGVELHVQVTHLPGADVWAWMAGRGPEDFFGGDAW